MASYAPIGPDDIPEMRTLAQTHDPVEMAAVKDIASLDEVITAMTCAREPFPNSPRG
ncbi:hypothetical protein [Mesorhizobium sp. B1-1-8]|uniref:hypothetical protein n=1 Tax=Mesorhizobium sp. B1-1-8 TaxID=2589976 RepID=UPI0015E325E4|nr:hypothetical protein [Mesorhizobium sp. B1-1-8]UCI10750.1 hypothetical protein FJ974_28785 [Mesorhizobium sp. B1-1-8]